MHELEGWESFYVIVGGAAGALIGLQFVVMTLIAERPTPAMVEIAPAFATPTIVHFCATLLISCLQRVPWPHVTAASLACGTVGLAGLVYTLMQLRRIRRQHVYKPDAEDWCFHIVLPMIAYALLALAPLPSAHFETETLFGIGAGVLLLLFAAIHNAWDAVTFQVFVIRRRDAPPE